MIQTSAIDAPPSLSELEAQWPVALFLDLDGTLVEIAATPESIVVPPHLAERLEGLADRMEGRLVVVSGRSLNDLERHLGPLRIARAGSHGIDCRPADGSSVGSEPVALPVEALVEARRFSDRLEVLRLEEKPHGAALHFRAAPELEGEVATFADQLAGRFGLKVKRGKCVLELVWPEADKANAVRSFMEHPAFSGSVPVFIGDDITDEDGFSAAAELGGFGILVGGREGTRARYRLASPADVHLWLQL